MKFTIKAHLIRRDVEVVEVTDKAGRLIATVTPGDDDNEIRVTSKYLDRVETEGRPPPTACIHLAGRGN